MRVLNLVAIVVLAVVVSSCSGGSPKSSDKVVHITKAEFEVKVVSLQSDEWKFLGDKPAIIDFYATWCPPCKKISPILDELAEEYDGRIDIYKVNIDVELELAAAFNIDTVPTLIFIPTSGEPEILVGAPSKTNFVMRIERMLREK